MDGVLGGADTKWLRLEESAPRVNLADRFGLDVTSALAECNERDEGWNQLVSSFR